jgi:aconitase A
MNYEYRKPLPGFTIAGTNIDYFDTRGSIEAISQGAYAKLPYTSRVLAEQLVRKCAPDTLTDCLKQIIYRRQELDVMIFWDKQRLLT